MHYSNITTSPLNTQALPPATSPAHSPGEPITIYSRGPGWYSAGNTQIAEFVTANPHKLIGGVYYNYTGNLSGVLDTEGHQFSLTFQFGAWPTGPNTFVLYGINNSSSTGPTLAQTYTLSGGFTLSVGNPPAGYPWEIPALTCQAMSCNLHVNVPLSSSDQLVYDQALRTLNNSRVGGTIYVELADEPWNETASNPMQFLCTMSGRVNHTIYNDGSTWFTLRAAAVGNIWRSVFATAGRQNEVCMMLNINNGGSGYANSANPALNGGIPCIFGALTCNTYSGPDYQLNTIGNCAYYANSLLPQSGTNNPDYIGAIADMVWHSIAFTNPNPNSYSNQVPDFTSLAPTMNGFIAAYNSANSTAFPNVVLYGYEGDMDTAGPKYLPTNSLDTWTDSAGTPGTIYTTNHDWLYDPTMRWYQKAFYALTQQAGYADVAAYSLDLGFNYSACWTYTESPAQWPGAGDGSDGLANNRLFRATPGLATTIPKSGGHLTLNQPANTVNPRLLAHQEWMGSIVGTTPTQLTLSGPSTGQIGQQAQFTIGLDQPDTSSALTVNLSSSASTDTFQSGGTNVTTLTIVQGSALSGFGFTPSGTAGNRTITVTIPAPGLDLRGHADDVQCDVSADDADVERSQHWPDWPASPVHDRPGSAGHQLGSDGEPFVVSQHGYIPGRRHERHGADDRAGFDTERIQLHAERHGREPNHHGHDSRAGTDLRGRSDDVQRDVSADDADVEWTQHWPGRPAGAVHDRPGSAGHHHGTDGDPFVVGQYGYLPGRRHERHDADDRARLDTERLQLHAGRRRREPNHHGHDSRSMPDLRGHTDDVQRDVNADDADVEWTQHWSDRPAGAVHDRPGSAGHHHGTDC